MRTRCSNHNAGTRLAIVSAHPDRRVVAAVTSRERVMVWLSADEEPSYELRDRSSVARLPKERTRTHLALDPSGRRLAEGLESGAVRVWDLESGALLVRLDIRKEAETVSGVFARQIQCPWRVCSLAWSASGASIATSGYVAEAVVWDVATGALRSAKPLRQKQHVLSGDEQIVAHPTRERFVKSVRGQELILWSFESGERIATLVRYKHLSRSLAASDRHVFTMDHGHRIRAWCWDTGRLDRIIEAPPGLNDIMWFGGALVEHNPYTTVLRVWDTTGADPAAWRPLSVQPGPATFSYRDAFSFLDFATPPPSSGPRTVATITLRRDEGFSLLSFELLGARRARRRRLARAS